MSYLSTLTRRGLAEVRMPAALLALLLAAGCVAPSPVAPTPAPATTASTPASAPVAPVAARKPYAVASPNGTRNDDYYWLRDDTRQSPEVLGYLNAENAYRDAVMAPAADLQAQLYDEMVQRLKPDDASVPVLQHGVWRYTRFEEGKEYPIDLLICASGFEVTSDLDLRWGIDEIRGRNGASLYEHWADGYKTLHGVVSRGFPNQFFTGYIQGGLYATTVEQFNRQGYHIAHIIHEALKRGIAAVEPTQAAQDAWVQTMAPSTAFSQYLQSECPPSYLNNESGKFRYYLGEFYLAGFTAFEQLLQDWRDKGDFEGMDLEHEPARSGASTPA